MGHFNIDKLSRIRTWEWYLKAWVPVAYYTNDEFSHFKSSSKSLSVVQVCQWICTRAGAHMGSWPEPFNWSALRFWGIYVPIHEVPTGERLSYMKYFPKRTFSDKILPEILFFFSSSFEHTPNLVKDLYGRISRKIRQKVSLRLVLCHSRSFRAIFLQIFSINNLCENRNLYFLFNLRAHVGNFVENTISMVLFPSYNPLWTAKNVDLICSE